MAEQTMSSEGRKQVAISMCSTPSGRSLAATAAGGPSPRSSTAGAKLVPLESFMKGTANSHYDDQDQEVPLVKKVAAEFIGTLILVFTVLSTVVANAQHEGTEGLLGVAVSAGLAVVAVVLSVVHISGSHLNPAVSLAMAVFGHLPLPHLLPYAAAQTLASGAAAFLARALYHPAHPAVMATVPADVVGVAEAFFLELVLAFVLMFVITAVATDPTSSKELIAIAIASTITMNALVGGPSTGPSMNPARTIGAAVATGVYKDIWVYLLATPLGAIAGAGAYTLIKP